ncbi:MAG: hypothetical protein KDI30_01225, partial [Pseudomonadales bacterium]|nr:hypothetical protein [Pseudomonadales bacterium]
QALIDAPDKKAHFVKSAKISFQVLSASFKRYGLHPVFIPLLFFSVFAVFLFELWQFKQQGISISLLFSAIALAYAGWYFLFCFSYAPKYPYTPVVFAVLALLFFLSAKGKSWLGILSIVLFAAFLPAPIWQSVKQDYWSGDPAQQRYNQDLLAVSQFIVQHKLDAPLAGCGWHIAPRSVEFVLPTSENFKDCFRLIGDNLQTLDASGSRFQWVNEPSFYMLIDLPLVIYNKQDMELRKPLQKFCRSEPIYQSSAFLILECPKELLVPNLNLNGRQAGRYYRYSHPE